MKPKVFENSKEPLCYMWVGNELREVKPSGKGICNPNWVTPKFIEIYELKMVNGELKETLTKTPNPSYLAERS